jgi:Skp family chaperone for outer membrane proteins
MTRFFSAAALAAAIISAPAVAQVAVADLDGAVQQTAAYQAAQGQIKTTYATQIAAFNARNQALVTQIQPLQKEIETLQANSATPRATLEAKANAFRTTQQNAQRELAALAAPFGRPSAYAQAQVAEKLDQAVKAAMTAKGIKIIVEPQAVLAVAPDANLTPEIVNQLNLLVKTVSVTPPAGWQPGQPVSAQAAATQGR